MEFERCEIRANKYGSLEPMYEFVAEAVGPHGAYIAARTPKFRRSFIPLPFVHGYGEFQDKPFHREMLNYLIAYLVHIGWEPLTLSGVDWYSRTFQRPISLYVSDPAPSMPYTLGDETQWQQKVRKLLNRYEQRRNIQSCHELAKGLLQFGLALERIHQFEHACAAYRQAAECFEEISSAEEAAKARRQADRVLELDERKRDK